MISNITLGKSGLPEYLVSGRKVGSEYSRDEKDHRLLIDGSEEALKDSIFSGRRQASRGCARIFTLKFSKSPAGRNHLSRRSSRAKNSLRA